MESPGILNFLNEKGKWLPLYVSYLRNRLRRDKNLSDVANKKEARGNLELLNEVTDHWHDSRYNPKFEALDGKLFAVKGDVDTLKSKTIPDISTKLNSHDTDINDSKEGLKERCRKLEERCKALEEKCTTYAKITDLNALKTRLDGKEFVKNGTPSKNILLKCETEGDRSVINHYVDNAKTAVGSSVKAENDNSGRNIVNTYATKTSADTITNRLNGNEFVKNGTTSNALVLKYENDGGQSVINPYVDKAKKSFGSSVKATTDSSGNNIINIYATKTALDAQKARLDGKEFVKNGTTTNTLSLKVTTENGKTVVAPYVDGTKNLFSGSVSAINDANGNSIVDTYATKTDLEKQKARLDGKEFVKNLSPSNVVALKNENQNGKKEVVTYIDGEKISGGQIFRKVIARTTFRVEKTYNDSGESYHTGTRRVEEYSVTEYLYVETKLGKKQIESTVLKSSKLGGGLYTYTVGDNTFTADGTNNGKYGYQFNGQHYSASESHTFTLCAEYI